jgi:hypothetical protein
MRGNAGIVTLPPSPSFPLTPRRPPCFSGCDFVSSKRAVEWLGNMIAEEFPSFPPDHEIKLGTTSSVKCGPEQAREGI